MEAYLNPRNKPTVFKTPRYKFEQPQAKIVFPLWF